MWNLCARCKNLENSENIWESFTGPPAAALSRGCTISLATASDPKQLGVSSAEWPKCDALLVTLQTSEIPRPRFPLQTGRDEPWAANTSMFPSGIFALSSAKASCWRQVMSFSTLRGVPIIPVPNCSFPFLSSKFSFVQIFCAPEGVTAPKKSFGVTKNFFLN